MSTGTLTPTYVPVLDGPAAVPTDELRPLSEARVPPLLPTAEMRGAKGRLEPVCDPPTRDEEFLAMNGWLAPDGALLPSWLPDARRLVPGPGLHA